ncbi:MAG: phospho-N-acetylmuramoyl-pentapeptide-transferase [Planctomycetota bacterium]|nr:phospho-N-acetylmuramoyl-pentapeptide-transferase [Planctomycetota bacterium]
MLYWIFIPLVPWFQGFNIFRYSTFRAAFAAILSFLIVIVCGPGVVAWLRRKKLAGCEGHDSAVLVEKRESKQAVPTMGGLLVLLSVAVSTLLFCRLDNVYVVVLLLAFLAFGALGAIDDWSKVMGGRRGLGERAKLAGQTSIAVAALLVWYLHASGPDHVMRGPTLEKSPWVATSAVATLDIVAPGPIGPTDIAHPRADHRTDLQVPFFKHFCLDLGLLFLLFGALVVVGASNAVNLTDGLDGLATGCVAITALTFAVVAYLVGRVDTSSYLFVFHIPGASELTVFLAAVGGAALGFLWFNGFPATVFMGDTGSLALGGALGLAAVATRHELTLLVAGGIFVAEAVSVILQRRYFKLTNGKRLFRCAPLHHHYEFQGLHEVKVTVRFWIVSVLLALVALALFKLR